MNATHLRSLLLAVSIVATPTFALAEDHPHNAKHSPTTQLSDDGPSTTHHTMTIEGQSVDYDATASTITLHDDNGDERAHMFYVAYARTPAGTTAKASASTQPATMPATMPATTPNEDPARPITFIFNGGPGAASIWLHMGVGGPKRIVLGDDGAPPAPPYQLADNAWSWLDMTDLVFIDPVGTGYSRAEKDQEQEFYGVHGDIDSVSDFIRIYLTEHQRWLSPKFLVGESYGTTRAAGLSENLHDRYGIDPSGITLISTVLNFQTLSPGAGNDTPFPLFFPTYAAIAHYHKKLPADLQSLSVKEVVAQAKHFAMTDYTTALAAGASLSDADRAKTASTLSRFSGLSLDYIKRSNLRVDPARFEKELLADREEFIGRMDGRFTGHNVDTIGDTPEFDPTLTGYVGVFASTFNDYVRRDLKFRNDDTYEFLSPRVRNWDFGSRGQGFYNVATTLREALTKLPKMKLFVACGYYDLATPLAAADYTLDQMPLGKTLRANVTQHYYEGGHMLYLNHASLVMLKHDLRAFYGDAISAGAATTQPEQH